MSTKATQEQSAVKTPCPCVRRMNDALRETYPGVRLLVNINGERPVIAVTSVSKRQKKPVIFPNFCPFCGVKYED